MALGNGQTVIQASAGLTEYETTKVPDGTPLRVVRLQKRLRTGYHKKVSVQDCERALRERDRLLRQSVSVSWTADDGMTFEPWNVSLSAYPYWVQPLWDKGPFSFEIQEGLIASYIQTGFPSGITPPHDAVLQSTREQYGVVRVTADSVAEPGHVIDAQLASGLIRTALLSSQSGLILPVTATPGKIINNTGMDLGPLTLLATGRSNFAGSGNGRIFNVRKGLRDMIDGILIPPGGEFSFNKAVHDMKEPGWEQAFAIMNGKDLVNVPGGGICQVATTVYRAALNTGLPVIERANHSLFVTYYTKYGIGIDATIYPKHQDLVFVNDTPQYILFQAYSKDFEAFVNVYGQSDGRQVTLEGPYFQSTSAQAGEGIFSPAIHSNEIGWVHRVRYADGRDLLNTIRSRYSSIPSSIKKQYATIDNVKMESLPGSLMSMLMD